MVSMLVALATLVVLPEGLPVARAQAPTNAAPLGLSAASWTSLDLPSELRIASLWVLPGPDGSPSAVDVRFAGPFTPPAGRWRVSVGVGDPAGGWQRLSMVWDGAVAAGVAEQVEGLSVADLGPVTATVDPGGSVVVGVPAGVLDAAGSGLLWAEAILGEDTAPTLLVRTPWFPRPVLAGEGAPGLLQGSTLGVPVPAEPGAAAPPSAPPVVDTGVPSVLELDGGELTVDRGTGPAELAGEEGATGAASVVDLVTLVGTPATTDAPPSGPQVRVDLVGGGVELGVGTVLGPLGPPLGDDTVVEASSSWLTDPGEAGSTAGAVVIDVASAFAAVGQRDPGDELAVTVTRVVTAADGSVVAAPGVLADRSWLQPGGEGAAASTAPAPGAEEEGAATGAPVVPIAIGTVLGVVLVGGAMVLAGRLHQRRHPGPGDWRPSATPPAAPPAADADAPGPGAPAAPPSAPADPPAAPPTEPPASQPVGEDPAPGPQVPGAMAELDDDLDELTARLRRLDDQG